MISLPIHNKYIFTYSTLAYKTTTGYIMILARTEKVNYLIAVDKLLEMMFNLSKKVSS